MHRLTTFFLRPHYGAGFITLIILMSCAAPVTQVEQGATIDKLELSDAEWKERLDKYSYYILREHGTEPAFSGDYYDNYDPGQYDCKGCELPLFSSEHKYKSGTGWPSFWEPISDTCILERTDKSYGMTRVEVLCNRCEGHLGHVFNDGPDPTGLRYCINSAALQFEPKE